MLAVFLRGFCGCSVTYLWFPLFLVFSFYFLFLTSNVNGLGENAASHSGLTSALLFFFLLLAILRRCITYEEARWPPASVLYGRTEKHLSEVFSSCFAWVVSRSSVQSFYIVCFCLILDSTAFLLTELRIQCHIHFPWCTHSIHMSKWDIYVSQWRKFSWARKWRCFAGMLVPLVFELHGESIDIWKLVSVMLSGLYGYHVAYLLSNQCRAVRKIKAHHLDISRQQSKMYVHYDYACDSSITWPNFRCAVFCLSLIHRLTGRQPDLIGHNLTDAHLNSESPLSSKIFFSLAFAVIVSVE